MRASGGPHSTKWRGGALSPVGVIDLRVFWVPLIHSGSFLQEVEILHFPVLSAQAVPLKYFRATSLGKRLLFGVDPDLGTSCLTYPYIAQTREE